MPSNSLTMGSASIIVCTADTAASALFPAFSSSPLSGASALLSSAPPASGVPVFCGSPSEPFSSSFVPACSDTAGEISSCCSCCTMAPLSGVSFAARTGAGRSVRHSASAMSILNTRFFIFFLHRNRLSSIVTDHSPVIFCFPPIPRFFSHFLYAFFFSFGTFTTAFL